jgi:hypothetical protein
VGRGRAGRRPAGGDPGRAGRCLAAAQGRGFRRGARRPGHVPRGSTRAAGEPRPVRLRRRRSPAPAALGAPVGCAGTPRVGIRAGRPHRAARPAQDVEPVGAVPAADGRRHGLAQSRPRLCRRRAGRDRRVRRGRPWPGAGRPSQRAGPPAAGRRPRRELLGRLPAGRGGRRGPPGDRPGPHRPARVRRPRPPPAQPGGGRRRSARRPGRGRVEPCGTARREKPPAAVGAAGGLRPARHRRARRLSSRQLASSRRRAGRPPRLRRRSLGQPRARRAARDRLPARRPAPRRGRRLDRGLDGRRARLPSGRGAADRGATGAPRVRRPLPGVPRQHRTQRTRVPPGRPGHVDPPGARLRHHVRMVTLSNTRRLPAGLRGDTPLGGVVC